MTKKTRELTNLSPKITDIQKKIIDQYAAANKTIKKQQIVLVGSSTTEIFPIEIMQTENDLGLDYKIYNRGVRAMTTADLLKHMNTLIFDLEPSKVFINIGSNDMGFNISETELLSNYDEILTQIQTRLPHAKIYAMAYYPINTADDFGEEKQEHGKLFEYRSNEKYNAMSDKIKKIATQHGVAFINANAGLTDKNGNLRKSLTFDGAHMLPQGEGYQIVFNNLKPYF
ncbi:GDSL-type esterase/lipase family protein [Leuconostoc pseudomesenteroides]|uniref:GDSL-type esterase/lipase family protein n=1 Tax=Leuconostoc pseudomesenteroides TaxID=33968 RepID=UPI00345ED6A1